MRRPIGHPMRRLPGGYSSRGSSHGMLLGQHDIPWEVLWHDIMPMGRPVGWPTGRRIVPPCASSYRPMGGPIGLPAGRPMGSTSSQQYSVYVPWDDPMFSCGTFHGMTCYPWKKNQNVPWECDACLGLTG